ncbi:MAG: hypothetical protein ACPGJS_03155 [Flammeovirgaceae bacterium]
MTKKQQNRFSILRIFVSSLKSLQRWDWKAIFVCLLIAFTFWVFHSLNTEHTTNIDFPIELDYNPKQVAIIEAPPKYVSVNVSGYGWNLLSKSFGFRLKPIKVPVNFPLNTTYLTANSLMASVTKNIKELKVNHLLEDSIFFKLDTIVFQKVPVIVNSRKIRLPENVRVSSSIRLSPDSVHVVGPATVIATSRFQRGVEIDYDFKVREDEFNELVDLEQAPYPLHITEPNVLVRFHTATYKIEHTRLRILFKNEPANHNFKIKPEFSYVEYLLREGEDPIHADHAVVEIDFLKINWRDSTVLPDVDIPVKYLEPKIVPERFKIMYKDQE